MRCWYLAVALLFSPFAHGEEQFCRNGFFPLKVGLLRSAKVIGSPAEHIPLEGDASGVPGAKWIWGSVTGGATVLVDLSGTDEPCVLVVAPDFDRFGLVSRNLLRLVPRDAPQARDWIGTFRDFDNEIEIGWSTEPGQVSVGFAGPLAERGGYPVGASHPSGDTLRIEQPGCTYAMQLLGDALVVAQCAGTLTRGDGIYRRVTAAPARRPAS